MDRLAQLSPSEQRILGLIADGLTNAAIAEHLYLSRRTVEWNINSILAKLDLGPHLGVNRRVAAVLVYLEENGRLEWPVEAA
jgi:DNA-binding NarL/FixJ family response regulator